MKVYGQLEFTQLEQVKGIPALVGPAVSCRLIADVTNTLAQPYFYDGTSWRNIFLSSGLTLVNSDIAANANIDASKIGIRQVVVGTAQTADGTTTSATFANPTNQPSINVTATYSGKYKIYCVGVAKNSSASINKIKITNTVGAAGSIFSEEAAFDGAIANIPFTCLGIFSLNAATLYTFTLQAKCSAGTLTISSSYPTNGIALIAEQIE